MPDTSRLARVWAAFREAFGREPRVFRAPGRVNLIGEHTDYNGGFVLPVAIDRDVLVAAAPAAAPRRVRLRSLNFGGRSEFSLDALEPDRDQAWSNYTRGVARYLQEAGVALRGVDAVVEGDVPIGSGLSSSAALEVASATALLAIAGATLDPVQVALICQRAEHRFVGVNCGIMDQYISCLGRAGHALLVDCRSLRSELAPLADGFRVVVADTVVRRSLAGSEYNVRRRQCEEAAQALGRLLGREVPTLRDVSPAELAAHGSALPEVNRRRAEHVVTENARTLAGVEALRCGDLARFGELMDESHVSLRDLYEVSCAELDALVEAARAAPGALGARMTGAGFGGCAVALVQESCVADFQAQVGAAYRARIGREAMFHVCRVVDGAGEVEGGRE